MEEKVLYNTLKAIGTGKENSIAPDQEYIKALETLGFIKTGWDNELTDFGKKLLISLQYSIENWA